MNEPFGSQERELAMKNILRHCTVPALTLGSFALAAVAASPAAAQWVRHPDRYVVDPIVQPIVVVQPEPDPVTTVTVERRTVVHDVDVETTETSTRDPYDTNGIVVAGAGLGGLLFVGDGFGGATVAYRLHFGLAVDQAEFGLRFDMAPDAIETADADGRLTNAGIYTLGATFNYRFLPGADVHPVVGAGLEGVAYDPSNGSTSVAFALTARLGLELACPLADGALALGIDTTGHQLLGGRDFPDEVGSMVSFGAYVDYRF